MSRKKDIRIENPLNYGVIWYPEYFEDKEQKEGLKKYNFKRKNKAKKYHRWECKFWNNTCELTIFDKGLFFDSYGLDETGEFMRHTLTFNIGVYFDYDEIKWFIETMQQINDMINNKKSERKIALEKDYKFVKQYSNYAFEFEKKYKKFDTPRKKNIIFWYDDKGGAICLSDGYEEDFIEEPNLYVNESEKPIFFDIMNQHLHIPLGLMKEILKDMETIRNN